MDIECKAEGLVVARQFKVPVLYRCQTIGEYKPDMLVNDLVIVEIKSVERFDPLFEARVLTWLKITGNRVGLLINFNSRSLKDGIKRFILLESGSRPAKREIKYLRVSPSTACQGGCVTPWLKNYKKR